MRNNLAVAISVVLIMLLSGCGNEDNYEPVPTMETEEKHVIPTYTATSRDIYSEEETEALYSASSQASIPGADTALNIKEEMDSNYIVADTAINIDEYMMDNADTQYIAENQNSTETADTLLNP